MEIKDYIGIGIIGIGIYAVYNLLKPKQNKLTNYNTSPIIQNKIPISSLTTSAVWGIFNTNPLSIGFRQVKNWSNTIFK